MAAGRVEMVETALRTALRTAPRMVAMVAAVVMAETWLCKLWLIWSAFQGA